jgi:hypothetical protein
MIFLNFAFACRLSFVVGVGAHVSLFFFFFFPGHSLGVHRLLDKTEIISGSFLLLRPISIWHLILDIQILDYISLLI